MHKEEKQSRKAAGPVDGEDYYGSESSSESEDEDAALLTHKSEKKFVELLSMIRNKDKALINR